MAVDPVEGQREYPCADQDEDHEGGELGGGFRGLAHQIPAQPTLERAERERPRGAHGAAFGRGRNADEDRAEHQKDQEQRRHHHKRHLLSQPGQKAEAEELVAQPVHDRDREREDDADEHRQHHVVGAMGVGAAHRQNGDRGAGGGEDGEGHEPARAIVLAESDRVGRQPGHVVREENGGDEHGHRVQARQRQAGQEGAFVHVADRAPELVGHDDQHQGGRDDLRQGAGGGDDARSHSPVVAVAQHDRQRDQPHRDHRCGDHAGRRRQ